MVLDLNQLPYFDDYNENKRYHRILFKPGIAVQARELTQLQTILQNQIDRFGKHIFQEGSIVLGGTFDPQDPVDYVRVDLSSTTVANELIGKKLTGSTTGLEAYVVHAEADPEEATSTVLFIRYANSSESAVVFQASEVLTNSVQSVTVSTSNSTGQGSIFGLGAGITFINGFFIKFESQKIAIDPFSTRPSKKVYFKYEFDTVTSDVDGSLLDNAQGFNNYAAPGADRLRATVTLAVSDPDVTLSAENHILIFEIIDGDVKLKNERTQYTRIYDELAKRTYDESGDYVVYGLDVFTRENLDTGTNGGRYAAADGGDANLVSIGVETGLAYVKGYEINNFSTKYIDFEKATDFEYVDNQTTYVRSGNYIEVKELTGIPDPDDGNIVNLYNTAEERISNDLSYTVAASGAKLGEARVHSVIQQSGVGGPDNITRIYLSDIRMSGNNSFGDVRSLGNTNFFADVVLGSRGVATLKDPIPDNKLFFTGSNYTRNLLDTLGNSDTSFQFYREKTATLNSSGSTTVSITTTDESMPYGTGTLGSLAKATIFLVMEASANVAMSGNVSISSNNSTVTGTDTEFTNLNIGDRVEIDSTGYIVSAVANNTSMTLTTNATSTYTGTYQKVYIRGDLIDLNGKGSTAGVDRTVTASSSSITINIQETLGTNVACRVLHKAFRNNAGPAQKDLRPSRYVKIDCSSAGSLSTIPLGFSDVYKIRSIRKKTGSAFTAADEGTDVTSSFTLDNGQRLHAYETATISPVSSGIITSADHLLIELDYFEPDFSTGFGYFSVDSYPINDTLISDTTITTSDIPRFNSPETFLQYDLRNYIDTRPIKTNLASDSTTVAGASTNPALSTVYNKNANGLRTPIPGTNITYDYSFYLARRDVLVVDKNGFFEVIQGQPAVSPGIPKVVGDYMTIANIFIPPYPSISSTYARLLNRLSEGIQTNKVTYSRSTMRQISNMEKRITNLEYYNVVNLLEKETLDLTITDENGLDRFKNGAFVDPFMDHSLGETISLDYSVSNDKLEKSMRPLFKTENFKGAYEEGTNIRKKNNILSLPYSETPLIERLNVTTARNVEFSSYRFIGNLELTPPDDTWVNTNVVDRTFAIETGVETVGQALIDTGLLDSEWTSWTTVGTRSSGVTLSTTTQTGSRTSSNVSYTQPANDVYKVYSRNAGNRSNPDAGDLVGTFSSLSAAKTAANSHRRSFIVTESDAREGVRTSTYETFARTTTVASETFTTDFERSRYEATLALSDYQVDIGEFVTDFSIAPYIRPQTIRLYAQGLKANTRFYIFFDNEDMTDYFTPVTLEANTTVSTDLSLLNEEGDPAFSGPDGQFLGFLRLPETGKQFRVGAKEVKITDTRNSSSATSYATASFVASGLNVQKQGTILSTKTAQINRELQTETKSTSRTSVRSSSSTKILSSETDTANITVAGKTDIKVLGPSCSAYSFFVDVDDQSTGVFLSSVDLWFEQLHPTLGVWFEIREMSSDGGITRNQVPFSEVYMRRGDQRLKTSADASVATNVNFDSPVFLYNKTQYAFIIHTEGLNPDTYFFVSELGGTDLITGETVATRPLTGTFYTTNNNLNWDIVPDVDLMIRFNRASYSSSGSAVIVNDDKEFIVSNDIPLDFFRPGELLRGSDIITLSATGSDSVAVDDIIRGDYGIEATVLDVDGVNVYTDTTGLNYLIGANVDIYDSANTIKDIDATISTVEFGVGNMGVLDRSSNTFIIENSNGKFFEGCIIKSAEKNRRKEDFITLPTTVVSCGIGFTRRALPQFPFTEERKEITGDRAALQALIETKEVNLPLGVQFGDSGTYPECTISGFGEYEYSLASVIPSYISYDSTTNVTFELQTMNTSLNNDTYRSVIPGDIQYDTVKTILSRSEEVRQRAGEKSIKLRTNLSSSTNFLSPIVDLDLTSFTLVDNIVNANTAGEDSYAGGGELLSKYISQVIDLEPGNEAEDLLLFLAEYRPPTTEVDVWVRFRNATYDEESIYQKDWVQLDGFKTKFSSVSDKSNFIDFRYTLPESVMTGSFGEFEYTRQDGNIYTGYTQFQIKIGLSAENKAVVPRIAQLRSIALQI